MTSTPTDTDKLLGQIFDGIAEMGRLKSGPITRDKSDAIEKHRQQIVHGVVSVVGNLLRDVHRIADALDQISMNTREGVNR